MVVSERLMFLELQKTGGSHIRRLLQRYAAGITEGKHNRLLDSPDRMVIGSIRNPWDWYVSLWAYGVGGKGAVRARSTIGLDYDYYYRMLPKAMGKNWISPRELVISVYHDIIKPKHCWSETYLNSDAPALFQSWLKLLLDKERRFDIGEGYGFSPLSLSSGLLTYRYFRLYTIGSSIFTDKNLADSSYMSDFDLSCNITSGMIKNESLEEDFITVMRDAGYDLSDDDLESILNPEQEKTNVSERKVTSFYYDKESSDLVAESESYLIGKYQYAAPV